MRRVSVVGSSGSGKSTVARRLADVLAAPYVELDALFWDPDWSAVTDAELRSRTAAAVAGDTWVVDGNYRSKVGALVWGRADTVVWVNPPRWLTVWRVTVRTARRAARREELWNGNRENWGGFALWRGDDSIIRWAWSSHKRTQERYEAAMTDPAHSDLTFHRLRSRHAIERFFDESVAGQAD